MIAVAYWSSLWFTVRHASRARRPELLLTIGLIIRLSVIALLFYLLIRDGHWDRLLVAFISFVVVRSVFIHVLGPHTEPLRRRRPV